MGEPIIKLFLRLPQCVEHPIATSQPKSYGGTKLRQTSGGQWLDHREAVIVMLSGKGRETRRVISLVENSEARFKMQA
jgi:hypothetical protein